MKFNCSKTDLLEAVSAVQRAVSNKNIFTVLEGILVTTSDGNIVLRGNDMEKGIEYTIEGTVEENGSVIVNSRIFGDIARKMPAENNITVTTDQQYNVKVDCGSIHMDIKGMDPEGFPPIPEVDKKNSIEIDQEFFREMIRQVIFSVGNDDSKPIFKGALMESKENSLNMVSLDGYRMSIRRESLLGTKEGMNVVVPGKALAEVMRLLKNDDDKVNIYYENSQILFDLGNCKLVSNLLQGEYLNYRSIYQSQKFDTEIIIDRERIMEGIDRAMLVITGDNKNPVTMNIADDEMTISSRTELGAVTERISLEKTGLDLRISFNPRFLLDVFKNINDERIKISFAGSDGPCIIEPVNGEEFLYVVLPVRTV
ncbi:MAG TPA: DNA polymerase III subunit beta [Clostridia bacterium]|nr:DNA polymerase III subunit beta [Clostridia bacterium]HRX41763.1 DNA polymerase III subunit beta [Clostridia bacterium]